MPDIPSKYQTITPSITEALNASVQSLTAAGSTDARRDSEVLLAHLLGVDLAYLFAHPERRISTEMAKQLENWVARRAQHEPTAYITGTREFWSLEITVNADVLIPRPDTERLVEVCLDTLSDSTLDSTLGPTDNGRALLIADIGTGSGAIVAALASELTRARFVGTDISQPALRVAESNLKRLGLLDRIELRLGDLYSALNKGELLDAIVSNPPYISERDLAHVMPDVRDFEPATALAGGTDGLAVVSRLVSGASSHLKAGAPLILEIGADQGGAVRDLLRGAGFEAVAIHPDLAGLNRVAFGRAPA